MSASDWAHFGRAGHFCAAHDCLFHLHTHVGRKCISTVGDWHPRLSDGKRGERPEEIGWGRLYETMVFELGDDGEISDLNGVSLKGYETHEEAEAGHLEHCIRWDGAK